MKYKVSKCSCEDLKIYSVYNSSNDLRATFVDKEELCKYLRRHKRDKNDTTVLMTIADSWNEFDDIENVTEHIFLMVYDE